MEGHESESSNGVPGDKIHGQIPRYQIVLDLDSDSDEFINGNNNNDSNRNNPINLTSTSPAPSPSVSLSQQSISEQSTLIENQPLSVIDRRRYKRRRIRGASASASPPSRVLDSHPMESGLCYRG